jgi:hypothetical protein
MEFAEHAARIPEFAGLNLSESDTRVYLIDPVLRMLGYVGVGDIRREVPVPATKEFLDYELYADGKAQAIVEAKAVRLAVTDQAAAQCVQYAAVLGVRWCIITNGVTWTIYNAHAKGPLPEKRVASVRLDGGDAELAEAWGVLALFARQSLVEANPPSQLLADRVILDELSRPDSPAVASLRRAVRDRFGERVTGQAVVDAIARLRLGAGSVASGGAVAADAPGPPGGPTRGEEGAADGGASPAARAWATRRSRQQSAATEPAELSAERTRTRKEVLKPDGTRVTLRDLIGARLIAADAEVECSVKGVTHSARVRAGGLEVGGTVYANRSAAASAARGGGSANGWALWLYRGESLGALRDRLVASLATSSPATG